MSLPYPYNNSLIPWNQNPGAGGTPPLVPPIYTGPDVMYETGPGLVLQGRVEYPAEPPPPEPDETPSSTPDDQPQSPDPYPPTENDDDDDSSEPANSSRPNQKLAALQRILSDNNSFSYSPLNNDTLNLAYQPANENTDFSQAPVTYQQINASNPQWTGQAAVAQAAQLQAQTNRVAVQQARQRAVQIFAQSAQAPGLPSSPARQAQHVVADVAPPDTGTMGVAQIQAAQDAIQAPPVRLADYSSLAHAQLAQAMLNYQAQVLENQRQAALAEQQRQAAHIAWANQHAAEMMQRYTPQQVQQQAQPTSPQNRPTLQAQVTPTNQRPTDTWNHMQAGQVLSDADMKQLFHDLDLQYYGAENKQEKQQAEWLKLYAQQKLAENLVAHSEKDQDGHVVLHGVPVRSADALYIARLDVQHFEQTDRHLKPNQLQVLENQNKDNRNPSKNILPLNARIQKDIDIINESGGLKYYKDSNNLPVGNKSYLPPKELGRVTGGDFLNITTQKKPNAWNYTQQAFKGQGQDVIMDANDLDFDTKSPEFHKVLHQNTQFEKVYNKYMVTGKPQPVNIETILLLTHDWLFQQDSALGKVKMKMNGYIFTAPNGKPVFAGVLQQGKNAEVYTFPAGNRGVLKEGITAIGRHSKLTQFRTFFRGVKSIWLPL